MDQLKQYGAVAWKHHFWILSGCITILFLVVWFLSASQMQSEAQTLAAKWEAAYSSANQIMQIQNHPNTESADKMKQLIRDEADQVQRAWELRFNEQADVLVWPEELLPDFIARVEPLKPIELKVPYDPANPTEYLDPTLRERYRNYIENELPKLAEIIGSQWGRSRNASGAYDGGMGEGMGMGMGMGSGMGMGMGSGMSGSAPFGSGSRLGGPPADVKPIVVAWNSNNQSELQQTLFSWGVAPPTTLQILYAQEDLWVLTALMNIIKTTNGDADAQYNAAIKEIDFINIGAAAGGIKDSGSLTGSMSGSGSSGSDMYGSSGSGMESGDDLQASSADSGGSVGASMATPGGSGSMGSGSATRRSVDPAENRYVNDLNVPLSGEELRTAIQSNAPSDAFLVVAKRMPIRIHVSMNLLKLPAFLSNLANSELPVEVRQVRLTVGSGKGSSGGSSGMYGGGMEGGGGGRPMLGMGGIGGGGGAGASSMSLPDEGMGGTGYDDAMMGSGGSMMGSGSGSMMGSGSGSMMSSGGTASRGISTSPYDGSAEIYGVIYIYNPVDPVKLGLANDGAPTGDTTAPAGAATAMPVAPAGAAASPDTGATPPATGSPATPAAPTAGGTPSAPAAGETIPPAAGAVPSGASSDATPASDTGTAPGTGAATPPAAPPAGAGGGTPPTPAAG